MDDPEGVDQVVRLDGHEAAELLRIARVELALQSEDREALAAERQALLRQVDRRELGARPSEVHRVRAEAATDLQDLLPTPALELREAGDVRLHEVLPCLDLVEVLARADHLGRVPNVARATIPVLADAGDAVHVISSFVGRGVRATTPAAP